jgi:hypothetical protein
MREAPIRDKDIGECPIALLANAEKLNLLGLVRQALKRQHHIRLTDELDLQTHSAFQLQFLLDTYGFCSSGLQPCNLSLKRGSVLLPG